MRLVLLLTCCALTLIAAERPRVRIDTDHGAIVCELFADQAPETVATFLALAAGERAFTDPKTGATETRPFYDGLTFHRIIDGFMIQGGCPQGDGSGGPGFDFADEINAESLGLDEQVAFDGQRFHPHCEYMWPQIQQQILLPALQAQGLGPQSPREQTQAAIQTVMADLRGISLQALYQRLGYRYRDDLPASTAPTRGVLAMANRGPATNGSQFFITLADTPHLTGKHTVFGRVVEGMTVVDAIAKTAADHTDGEQPREAVVIKRIRPID